MAMKRSQIELIIEPAVLRMEFHGTSKPTGKAGPNRFRFGLCSKEIALGNTAMTQWWLDSRVLYPDRGRRPEMFRSIVDYFWARASREATISEPAVAESILLAHLLPHVRSHGSRRVFADAIPKGFGSKTKVAREAAAELQNLLQSCRGKTMDVVQFRDQTGEVLGPPEYEERIMARYSAMTDDLLADALQILQYGGTEAPRTVNTIWKRWMKKIGRRGGHEEEKLVLDILSYECRAAFHRCFSALWHDLIPLMVSYRMVNEFSARFHSIWNLDRIISAEQSEMNFHLFHGHILGLHPVGSQFIQTERGRELLEGWVTRYDSKQAFEELLFGLSLAVFQYSNTRDEQKLSRRLNHRRRSL